jgi:hypothetical protein
MPELRIMGAQESASTGQSQSGRTYSETIPGAPLEEVLLLNELENRPFRPPNDHALESAFKRLLQGMTSSPSTILQSLAETMLEVLHCDSAGVSVVNDDNTRFFWAAIAGVWKPYIGGGTPRYFGPCADVLEVNRPLHMQQVHKRYTYFTPVALVDEVLLVPFYKDREPSARSGP